MEIITIIIIIFTFLNFIISIIALTKSSSSSISPSPSSSPSPSPSSSPSSSFDVITANTIISKNLNVTNSINTDTLTANTKIELTDGVTGMDKINGISATNIGCQNLQALNAQIDGTLQTSGNLDESILAKGYFGFANIENSPYPIPLPGAKWKNGPVIETAKFF